MYTVKFNLEWFSSDLASSSESFIRAGTERVRVRLVDQGNYGPCDGYVTYVAKSRSPFVIIITRRGDGGNSHMGMTTVLSAGANSLRSVGPYPGGVLDISR